MVDGYETRKLHSSYPGFNAKPQNLKLRYFCVEILALRSYSVMLVFTLIILWNGSRSNDSFECGRVHQFLHQAAPAPAPAQSTRWDTISLFTPENE